MHVAAPSLQVTKLDPARKADWDSFVETCPEATFCHRAGWQRVIEDSFGHQTHYLLAERGGRIEGVLPLTHVKSRLFGNALIGNAFCVYGGPAAISDEARDALDAEACRLADSLGAHHLEYRSQTARHANWAVKDQTYFTFRRDIFADEDANLKAIRRKQRAVVRASLTHGLKAVIAEDHKPVHALYADSVRRLGTPVFTPKLFQNLKAEFQQDCEFLLIEKDGRAVASLVSFWFRDQVAPYYAGGLAEARRWNAHDFMYWNLMCRAADRGARTFDFGRSKAGTGPFSFKKNWGFTPQALEYEYRLKPGRAMPDLNPNNPKYRLFVEGWKKLPAFIADRLGPILARDLG